MTFSLSREWSEGSRNRAQNYCYCWVDRFLLMCTMPMCEPSIAIITLDCRCGNVTLPQTLTLIAQKLSWMRRRMRENICFCGCSHSQEKLLWRIKQNVVFLVHNHFFQIQLFEHFVDSTSGVVDSQMERDRVKIERRLLLLSIDSSPFHKYSATNRPRQLPAYCALFDDLFRSLDTA